MKRHAQLTAPEPRTRSYSKRLLTDGVKIPDADGRGVVRRIVSHPRLIPELARYVGTDVAAYFGRHVHSTHVALIVALPKSGSTWVRGQLGLVPGFNVRP